MLEQNLKQLDFTPNEIKVYLALFAIGKSRAGKIIASTGLHRNLVYTSLETLEKRNLITKVLVKGVAEFSANSPTSLIDEIENKKQLARQAADELEKLAKHEERDIKIYEGLDGIKQARSNILNLPKGSEFFVLGASKLSQTPKLENFWRAFHKKREAKGIKQKTLYESTTDQGVLDSIKWRNQLPNMKTRFLPFEIDSPLWFDFAEDHVNLGLAGKDPLTINIKSRDLANGFKKYFEYFWDQRVRVKTGVAAVKEAIYEQLNSLAPGQEYLILGAKGADYPEGIDELYDEFHTDRIKKGVVTKMICYEESYEGLKKRFEKCGDIEGKISFLKKYASGTPIPMQINMYKNKTFFILYEKTPVVIYFDNPIIFQTFNNYFNDIWNQKVHTHTGFKALHDAFYNMINELGPGEEYYVLGTMGHGLDKKIEDFFDKYHNDRIKKKINLKMLCYEESFTPISKRFQREDPENKFTQLKIYHESPPAPMQIVLYKQKAFITIYDGHDTTVIHFDEPNAYAGFKNHFDKAWDQRAKTYEGVEQIKRLFMETMEFGNYSVFAEGMKIIDVLGEGFFTRWQKEKQKRGTKSRGIMNARFKSQPTVTKSITQMKFIPGYTAPGVTLIFKDKVASINFSKNPTAFLIEDAEIARSNQSYFDLLWNQKIITSEGQKEVEQLYNNLLETANSQDKVMVFAAKPSSESSANFNLEWNKKISKKTKGVRLLYYGNTGRNRERAQELTKVGCQAKTLPTEQELPISTIIIGDKILSTVWNKKPIAFYMKDETTAAAYKENFELLWNQETFVLKGLDAIEYLFEEMLAAGHADLIGARGYFIDRRPEFIDDWEKRARRAGFTMRNIVDPGLRGHRITKFPFAKTKYTLNKEFSNLSVFWIFGDKLAISNWTEKEPFAIIIDNKHVHDMYKQQFELLWRN